MQKKLQNYAKKFDNVIVFRVLSADGNGLFLYRTFQRLCLFGVITNRKEGFQKDSLFLFPYRSARNR